MTIFYTPYYKALFMRYLNQAKQCEYGTQEMKSYLQLCRFVIEVNNMCLQETVTIYTAPLSLYEGPIINEVPQEKIRMTKPPRKAKEFLSVRTKRLRVHRPTKVYNRKR